ncbi:DUF4440 domain-containing protein [Burkholderia vietnamiensis]|jgi:hypothetical protein|uniref:DUF4440 domain-containing protein n=2 Tax=Burkholderia vietnamiensis TaxID=60552 RepID=A4JM85_BURVG|nr:MULTISPECIES: hypothetical protein [Burkholderia]ABO57388.1 conserved hypothetical protein [Burkholderia vietnamiensis G4]AFJ88423.1 Putative cytoplasmic protein [Burkholderia sp. KJ006]AJY03369.1 hypothetical protein AK36_4387 [Burkholderia vietnamiensis LMG 10929]AOJ98251.1 hypothetical protein WK23_06120 [Burkholderia vietnamiensis]AOK12859.1 hypothetical protein WK31_21650 [Burkholderia vietnamiensis]
MNPSNPYFQEVIDAHVDIEQWLSGRATRDALAPLLARFSRAFSMISLQGHALDYADIDILFSRGYGARPGLRIAIDELHEVSAWQRGAAIAYRETQTDEAGRRTVRRSTVVFERDADGRIGWLRLHETPVTG